MSGPAAYPVATPVAQSAQAIQAEAERATMLAKAARDHARADQLRVESGYVEVVAVVGFTIHDNVLHENGRVINRGDRLTISRYDLERGYAGKVALP